MINRGLPKDLNDYIKVHYSNGLVIHQLFYPPAYIYGEYLYFKKSDSLLKYLGKEEDNEGDS